jgi:hypothetical protein
VVAVEVLERATAVLVRAGCTFKFASTIEFTGTLGSSHYPRGGADKFLTAYSSDDEQLRRLAAELDRATAGLAGQAILSDRPYRKGSLVHYRYGAFSGRIELSNDGEYVPLLTRPDGSTFRERRDAWFEPPEWASPPLPDTPSLSAHAPVQTLQPTPLTSTPASLPDGDAVPRRWCRPAGGASRGGAVPQRRRPVAALSP